MLADFHTHTFLSDGVLSPVELIRRCQVNGYTVMAISDHTSLSNIERVISEVRRDAELAAGQWGINVLTGVELTHVPAAAIDSTARMAKTLGAQIVLVHGETIVEPVEPGTNLAAVRSRFVDVLAHPGLLSEEEARIAAENDVFIELSARKGHCLGNGRTAALGLAAGAKLLVNSDSHAPGDILTPGHARSVAKGAGLSDEQIYQVLFQNPEALLLRLARKGSEFSGPERTV